MKKSRAEQFAELNTQLKVHSERSQALELQTKALSETLGSNQARGAWGERMAEDILRTAGFVEGVNYLKQNDQGGARPDFTFLLPQDLILNMDVKFPYKQFVRVIESDSDEERERHAKSFMTDVKARLKEVSGKAYIDAEANTVDYVLLFIPNDQIYFTSTVTATCSTRRSSKDRSVYQVPFAVPPIAVRRWTTSRSGALRPVWMIAGLSKVGQVLGAGCSKAARYAQPHPR